MQPLFDMDCQDLINLIKAEQPQTIALIISYFPAEKGSQLLALLASQSRAKMSWCGSLMGASPVEVVEKIVNVFQQKTGVETGARR